MTYLNDMKEKIDSNDYPGFIKIWEEYCFNEDVDFNELREILFIAKKSDLSEKFGEHVNRALDLWEKLKDKDKKNEILKLIIDMQNKNDEDLADLVYNYLKENYSHDPLFNEKIKLVGLRDRINFQGAISKFELLNHINKGKFVFHTTGWGTGEILDFSLLRQELILEFEYVIGHKSLSFENALNTLIPLPEEHFLSRRFGNPDLLETLAKETPAEVVKLLLNDLGPKTASEIKDNLYELVIPADEWNKWWQSARNKMKKDELIEFPSDLSKPFKIRKEKISHEDILQKSLETKISANEVIQMVHSFLRDYSETLKNEDFRNNLIGKLIDVLSYEDVKPEEILQINFFLEQLKAEKKLIEVEKIINETANFSEVFKRIEIVANKKKLLTYIRKYRKDWEKLFFELFFDADQNATRDYILNELLKTDKGSLKSKIQELLEHPLLYPQTFVWYFQKLLDEKNKIPFSGNEGKLKFFEGLLILLDHVSSKIEMKDFSKKIISIITENRYELVRDMMKEATLEQAKEFILLSTKCALLSDHEIKIINSLAKVAHPSLIDSQDMEKEDDIIWVTEQGYFRVKSKLEHLTSVETIENAKEIEEARSHGDLRENAEYKAALERRDRLQSEIKQLADQINKLKLIVKDQVTTDKVNVGTVCTAKSAEGKTINLSILGPFEANAEENVLSFQSKLAKDILGKIIGDRFNYKNTEYTIVDIRNYFE